MVNICIVAFEGISLFHLSVPMAIFKDAILDDKNLFNVQVCAEGKEKLNSSCGLSIEVEGNISLIETADVVIIPTWLSEKTPSSSLIEKLKHAHNKQKLVVGLCLGAFAVAYSGLLDGKRATTHWKSGELFASKFPAVHCDINPLYVIEENIITSAGSAAAIDCCLYIVKKYYGVKIANKIARVMVSSPERSGGQNQYIETPLLERPRDERIAKLIDLILANITNNYTLESAADYCLMSVRNFSRQFKAANGITFTAWLVNTRLNYSLEILESTDLSITQVSSQAGFSSEQIFRKHFKQRYDTTPKAWRTMFRSKTVNSDNSIF